MKKLPIGGLCILLLFSVTAFGAEKKEGSIAVASEGRTTEASVGEKLGRSSFYLLFDTQQGKFIRAIDNPFKDARGRAGQSAIDSLRVDEKGGLTGGFEKPSREEREKFWNPMLDFFKEKGIFVVVAEEFGDDIINALEKRRIRCVAFKGTAAQAVKKVLENKTEGQRRSK
jgi:predicted Fe-Mo cluster-binding NifX family protein